MDNRDRKDNHYNDLKESAKSVEDKVTKIEEASKSTWGKTKDMAREAWDDTKEAAKGAWKEVKDSAKDWLDDDKDSK